MSFINHYDEYPLSINFFRNGEKINYKCKEIDVIGKKYSKIISNTGEVAIIYVPVANYEVNICYGYFGWSNCFLDKKIKEKVTFDSNLVKIISETNIDNYNLYINQLKLSGTNIPDHISHFYDLKIYFIPINTYFKINTTITGEYIEIFTFKDFFKS